MDGLDPIVRPGTKQKERRAVRILPLPFWEMRSARAPTLIVKDALGNLCTPYTRSSRCAVSSLSYIGMSAVGGGQGTVRAIVARNGQPRGGGAVGTLTGTVLETGT
ncbi:hypothetical protein TRAPUB_8998 [Trametes pubescens]|uniref:Uncharacterized protein n=1 Tax=Trametes pubescens TaxID=154538 RepID=A0A1M2W3R0_TRAPU|nr:hypothetical protein TRAPUB_8998 [Trametes pubescens]